MTVNSPISVDPRPDRSDSSLVWALAGPIRRGVVTDISASGLNATASGGVLNTRDECWGEGWRFNGASLLTGGVITTTWSAGYTFHVTAQRKRSATETIFYHGGTLRLGVSSTHVTFYFYTGSWESLSHAISQDDLAHSYAGVYVPGTGFILYIDGNPVESSAAAQPLTVSSGVVYLGTLVTSQFLLGDIYAAAVYKEAKSAAWVKAQWNRLAPACRLYIPPYSASLPGQIPLGTVVGPAWIPGTPIYVFSSNPVVELDSIDGRDETVLRWTGTGLLALNSKGMLNGALGPAAELGVGEYEFRTYQTGASVCYVDCQPTATAARLYMYADGSAIISRKGGANEAVFAAGTISGDGWHKHRLRMDKTAAGSRVTWWMDGKLMVPTSGSNPTGRWTSRLPQP